MATTTEVNQHCPIARSLTVVGEKWSLLVIRDLGLGFTRYSELRRRLGVSTDILSDRLNRLVDEGVAARRTYQDEGERPRDEYVLTDAGRELLPVLAALAQWGAKNRPDETPLSIRFTDTEDGSPVHVSFVDAGGTRVPRRRVQLTSTISTGTISTTPVGTTPAA